MGFRYRLKAHNKGDECLLPEINDFLTRKEALSEANRIESLEGSQNIFSIEEF